MLSQDYATEDYDFQTQSQNDGFLASQDQQRYNSQPRNDRFNGAGGTGAGGNGNFSQGMQFSQVSNFCFTLNVLDERCLFSFTLCSSRINQFRD